MTYEKEIPAYALQVARPPQSTPCAAVYHTEKIVSPLGAQKITHYIEEDILVPDTKEDMGEILLMETACTVSPRAKKLQPKIDNTVQLTGIVEVQTLYLPEKGEGLPVAITSTVPYKCQWQGDYQHPVEVLFSCHVKELEHAIINERKFRIKMTLEFCCQIFEQHELPFFQNLEDEHLELQSKPMNLCTLSVIKRDSVAVDTWLEAKDIKEEPLEILQQCYWPIENYRQITSEKIVINGFVIVNLLCKGVAENGEELLFHHMERVEFMQFMPLEKEQRGKQWSLATSDLQIEGWKTSIETKENGQQGFHVQGNVESCVTLYEMLKTEVVTDAYHLEKQFACQYEPYKQREARISVSPELSIREVIQVSDGENVERVISCTCRPVKWEVELVHGQILISGTLLSTCLWEGNGLYHTTKRSHTFHLPVEVDGLQDDMILESRLMMKTCYLTPLNDRQAELVCSMALCCDGYLETKWDLLAQPAFVECSREKKAAMIIAVAKKGETLWDMAKRYQTTETQIQKVNRLEGEPREGQKIFIIK